MPDSDNQSLNLAKKAENDEILAKAEEELNAQLSGEQVEEVSETQEQPEGPKEEPKTEEEAAPAEETPSEEQPKTEADTSQSETETETEEVDLSQISARGQDRIKELAEKAKQVPELERKMKVLESIVRQTRGALPRKEETPAPSTSSANLPWDQTSTQETTEEDSQELTEAQLEEKIKKTTREEIDNENIAKTLETDAILIEDQYPVFRKPTEGNPNPEFDPELTNFVWDIYLKEMKEDKFIRLSTVVDKVMAIRSKAAEQGKKASADILAKQASEQAIDPSGTPASTPSANDNVEGKIKGAKSMKDLEALEKLISAEQCDQDLPKGGE